MIRHIVMWKFKDFAMGKSRAENLAWVRSHLLALPAVIPAIKKMEMELDQSGNTANYDAVLLTEFEHFDALEAYKTHPAHQEVSQYVAQVAEARSSVDYLLG